MYKLTWLIIIQLHIYNLKKRGSQMSDAVLYSWYRVDLI